jgi:hypothetical protein
VTTRHCSLEALSAEVTRRPAGPHDQPACRHGLPAALAIKRHRNA